MQETLVWNIGGDASTAGAARRVPEVAERILVDRLEDTVSGVISKTAETTCSMVWDWD